MSTGRGVAFSIVGVIAGVIAGVIVGSCTGSSLGTLDVDTPAIDVAACARGDASCILSGHWSPVETVFPGFDRSVRLDQPARGEDRSQGGSLEAPLLSPDADHRLRFLALGFFLVFTNREECPSRAGITADQSPFELDVSFIARDGTSIGMAPLETPIAGWRRFEVSIPESFFHDRAKLEGARLKLSAVCGDFELVYVVGRWGAPSSDAGASTDTLADAPADTPADTRD